MPTATNTKENPATTQPLKRKTGGRKGIGIKAKLFAEEYVKTLNGTQSALKVYDTDKPNVAQAIASENLSKPIVKDYVQQLFDAQISDEELTALHVRNARQTEQLATSQKAIESLEVIKGLAKADTKTVENQTVNVFITAVQDKVKDFEQTLLQQLYAQNPPK